MFSSPPSDNRTRRSGSAAIRLALSHPIRVYFLYQLEGHPKTLKQLAKELPHPKALNELKYHVDILLDSGLVQIARGHVSEGSSERVYSARLDAMLEDLPEADARVAFEDQPCLHQCWLEIETDQMGRAQLAEVNRATRLQFLIVEEQSLLRSKLGGEELQTVVVGAVAIRSPTDETP
jgi:hypothetical protein